MSDYLKFNNRTEFRKWLEDNCRTSKGVWLLFGKTGGPKTIKADEALEEALCFGWIDGQMRRLDELTYVKYFAERTKNSNWSAKNKALVSELEKKGLLSEYGMVKVAEAKKNGQWEAIKDPAVTDKQIIILENILKEYKPAYQNFVKMSPSVKKTYTRAYFAAKTPAGQTKRLVWIVDRLNKNLKPM